MEYSSPVVESDKNINHFLTEIRVSYRAMESIYCVKYSELFPFNVQ